MNPPTDFIPFALPKLGKEEEEAVLKVMRSGWLTTGKEAKAFEEEFARTIGANHALALNSATAGLHLALETLEIPENSWVITTPYTFTATAEVIRYRNAHPLFVDIDPQTLNIDPEKLETLLRTTDKPVSAFIPVHIGGQFCNFTGLLPELKDRGIKIVEDCAHALPCTVENQHAGTWGDMGVFSFYATKTITTGEGGMIVTDNPEWARKIACLRLHGIDRQVWDRFQSRKKAAWEYDVIAPGYKYNMTDMAAAMGRVQLTRAGNFLSERRDIAKYYRKKLENIPGLLLPEATKSHAWHLFVIQLTDEFPMDRQQLMDYLAQKGIGTSVHYKPLHLTTYYSQTYGLSPEDFPNATDVYNRCLSLPIYPGMADTDRERVIEAVKSASQQKTGGLTQGAGKLGGTS